MLGPNAGFPALDSPLNADDDCGIMELDAGGGGGIENAV